MEIVMRMLALRAALIVLASEAVTGSEAASQDKFQKITGAQIRARLAGMEITDEAHWADVFAANGTLTSYSMGRKKAGKWHVQRDELCIDRGEDDGGCYQVWLSGKRIELRREGSNLPLEGVLQKQSARR
jgi:hypothetical protein